MIREARETDIEPLVCLLGELFLIESDFTPSPDKQRRGLRMILDCPEYWRIFVSEIDNSIIGMCSVHRLISTAEGEEAGIIEDVVVSEKFRRQGVGRRLIEAAETWAKQQGLARLQLLTDYENKSALTFYEKLGWSTTRLTCLRKIPMGFTKSLIKETT